MGAEAERGQIRSRRSMKMLWKLTDNIKYEDCEVSATLAQLSLRPQAPSSTLPHLLFWQPAEKCRWDKLSPAQRPTLRFARRTQGRAGEAGCGRSPFRFPPSKPVSHFPTFSDQYCLCLTVDTRYEHGFLKQLLATGHAPVHSACLSSEILGDKVTRKRKDREKPFFLL